MMSLNNLRFHTDDVEIVRPGDVEYWDIINVTTDSHPIHLHMALMQVLWRQPYDALSYLLTQPLPAIGQRWAPSANAFFNGPALESEPWDAGWHDTVEVPPGYVTRLLVRWPAEAELGFDPDATFPVPDRVEAGAPAMLEDGATDPNALMPMRLGAEVQPEADRARGYVWHCHILDHEDHDMMLPFRLVAG